MIAGDIFEKKRCKEKREKKKTCRIKKFLTAENFVGHVINT